jgi:hypothetical protein
MHSDVKKRRSFVALFLPPVICGVNRNQGKLMKQEVTYDYKPKPILAIIAMLMFFGVSYAGSIAAMGNERGVKLAGIVFNSTITKLFLWVFVALTIYMGLKMFLAFINGLKGGKQIILNNDSITSPKSVTSGKLITVKFTDIQDIRLQKNSGKLFLRIQHKQGKLIIPSVVFDGIESFQDLVKRLNNAITPSG